DAPPKRPVRTGEHVRRRRHGRGRDFRTDRRLTRLDQGGARSNRLKPEQYMTPTTQTRGGSWLLEAPAADLVFTPERLTQEHRLIAQTAAEFASSEVLPAVDRLEQKDWATARALLKRCGDLGLLGINVPDQYGGVELD